MDFGMSRMGMYPSTPGNQWATRMSPPVQQAQPQGDGFWDRFAEYLNSGGAEAFGNLLDMTQGIAAQNQRAPVYGGRTMAPAQGAPLPNPGMLMLSRLMGGGR